MHGLLTDLHAIRAQNVGEAQLELQQAESTANATMGTCAKGYISHGSDARKLRWLKAFGIEVQRLGPVLGRIEIEDTIYEKSKCCLDSPWHRDAGPELICKLAFRWV